MPQDQSAAPIREQRLGSIIGYEGTAADLVERSHTGRLRNRNRSFTQAASCSSSCAICLLSLVQDAAVVNHAPLGCSADFSMFNLVNRWGQTVRGLPAHNAWLVSTNLGESEAVFGGVERLGDTIREAHARFGPKAIFITASCTSAITGEDVDGVANELAEELGIPVAAVHCEGFRSQVWSNGFDAAYQAILNTIVKPPAEKTPEYVNIITFWGEDVFTDLFAPLGLKPRLVVPFSTVEELEKLSESGATAQICSTLGTYLAAGLEERFGVPEVKSPPPFGIAGTDAWLRALGATLGKEDEVEALIASEKEAIAADLEELRAELTGLKGYVAAGSVHGHSIAALLNDLGIETIGSCFWHHDPVLDHGVKEVDSLKHLVSQRGDLPVAICNKQSYELVNQLRRLKPDVFIVRHSGMAVWGGKLGIPTFLVEDEHFGLGYRGLIRYGRKILDAVSNPSFVRHLAEHTKLPYTQWWLDQPPFTFLEDE